MTMVRLELFYDVLPQKPKFVDSSATLVISIVSLKTTETNSTI